MLKEEKHVFFLSRVAEGTELRSTVWLAVLFMLLVTSIFALMFMKMEHWSFSKSLYFIFITFTTIGFGDIVPHNDKVSFPFSSYFKM